MSQRCVRQRVDYAPPAPAVPTSQLPFSATLLGQFEQHAARLSTRARERRATVQLKSTVLDKEEREQASEVALLGVRQPQDEFQGDVNLRTLRSLLKMIDDRGFERCVASFPDCYEDLTPTAFESQTSGLRTRCARYHSTLQFHWLT